MKKQFKQGLVLSSVFTVSSAIAGTFWFPIEQHYPYDVTVTSVPDLDNRNEFMRSRMNQTGKRSNGCMDDATGIACVGNFSSSKVWGYKKDSGGTWEFDGVPYAEDKNYLYYDNHRGYDFLPKTGRSTRVHAVEAGYFCGYNSTYGQVCIQHTISDSVYKTFYTHMANIPTAIKQAVPNVSWINKWDELGNVSNQGTDSLHLHFVTCKYDPNHQSFSTRSNSNCGPGFITVDPYGLKDGPGQPDIESYLWN
jgi:hypothetical protein